MTNVEVRMTKETRNPNDEGSGPRLLRRFRASSFVIDSPFGLRHSTFIVAALALVTCAAPLSACPFCAAVGLTLGDEIDAAAVAVIAQYRSPGSDDPNLTDPEAAKAEFAIVRVLKGREALGDRRTIRSLYFAEPPPGAKFLVLGNNPPDLKWATPVTLTPRGWEYLRTMRDLPPKGHERLLVALKYLEDQEEMLRRDSYDEFARAPFDVVKKLGPQLDPQYLLKQVSAPVNVPNPANGLTNRAQIVRLYCTLLGVCGTAEHTKPLETILRSGDPQYTPALDAMIAAYLRLAGADGLPLMEELFLTSQRPEDGSKSNAAINALRFHGQEPDIIPRARVVELLRKLLDRPQLAARVLADLARWSEKPEDWKDVDRVAQLFEQAKGDTLWTRDPAVGYLMACPLPEAKAHLERLAKIDPAAVKRGSSLGLPTDSTVYLGGGPAVTQSSSQSTAGPAAVSQLPTAAGRTTDEAETMPALTASNRGTVLWTIGLPVAGGLLAVVLLAVARLWLRGRPSRAG